jgi:hypothetical protein
MKFSSSAGPDRTRFVTVFGEETLCHATVAGEALTELGAEQKKSAVAVTNTTRKATLGGIGTRRDQVGYGCENVRTRKQLLSAPMLQSSTSVPTLFRLDWLRRKLPKACSYGLTLLGELQNYVILTSAMK